MNIIDKLKELNEIDSINSGGCAIAAYALVEFMKIEHNVDDASVVYLYNTYARTGQYANVMNGEPDSCHHAVVRCGDTYYDSWGEYFSLDEVRDTKGMELSIEVSQDYVLQSINNLGWNNWFERWTGVPEIFRILGLSSDIKNLIEHDEGVRYGR